MNGQPVVTVTIRKLVGLMRTKVAVHQVMDCVICETR